MFQLRGSHLLAAVVYLLLVSSFYSRPPNETNDGEDYFIVYVKSREEPLGLFLGRGGAIEGFTPESPLGTRQSGVRVGDRLVSVNAQPISTAASVSEVVDVIRAAELPFALIIHVNYFSASLGGSNLPSLSRIDDSRRRELLATTARDGMVIEKELWHAHDADKHHQGTGVDIDAYMRRSNLDINSALGNKAAAGGSMSATSDARLVIKHNSSLSVLLSDGPFKNHEFEASAAAFSSALSPGQCISRRLFHDQTNPMLCSSSPSSASKESIILVRRGSCSFHHKALHAAQIQAHGVLIINTEDSHFAAPADPALTSANRGSAGTLPSTVHAAMVSKSSGEAALLTYIDALKRRDAVQIKICNALAAKPEGDKDQRTGTKVPMLYRGQRPLEADSSESISIGIAGVSVSAQGYIDSPTLLNSIPRHPLEDRMAALSAKEATQRRDEQQLEQIRALLPAVDLPYAMLRPAAAALAVGTTAAVHADLRLRHQSSACLVFFLPSEDGSLGQPPAEENKQLQQPEKVPSGGEASAGVVTVKIAIVPCRGTSDAFIAIALRGSVNGSEGEEGGVMRVDLSTKQLDSLLLHALTADLQMPDSPPERRVETTATVRARLRHTVEGRHELRRHLAELARVDHSAQGGESHASNALLGASSGGALSKLRSRLVKGAMERHLPPQLEGRAAVFCETAPLAQLLLPASIEAGPDDFDVGLGWQLEWVASLDQAHEWLRQAGLSLSQGKTRGLLLTVSLRMWLQADEDEEAVNASTRDEL